MEVRALAARPVPVGKPAKLGKLDKLELQAREVSQETQAQAARLVRRVPVVQQAKAARAEKPVQRVQAVRLAKAEWPERPDRRAPPVRLAWPVREATCVAARMKKSRYAGTMGLPTEMHVKHGVRVRNQTLQAPALSPSVASLPIVEMRVKRVIFAASRVDALQIAALAATTMTAARRVSSVWRADAKALLSALTRFCPA